ncbi:MAG TPA: T9SS type A sorting domain-containing protein [Bacteroidales bacterium]|nr:T9SS type A sorting domain-containing protein [Bacteroidales bacterium]
MFSAHLRSLFLFILLYVSDLVPAQTSGIGQWKDYLPYNNCTAVVQGGTRIYAATPYSLFYVDKSDNSITRLNKVNGLSDVDVAAISYSETYNTLIITYANANVDLVKNDVVINIPDIKRKQILGNKTINSITVIGKYAYLACGFGIVVLDIDREEIHDTWYIGPDGGQLNVFSIAYAYDKYFYAATDKGIFYGDGSLNLAYYINWTRDTAITNPAGCYNFVAWHGGKLYVNATTVNPSFDKDTMLVYNGLTWEYFEPDNHSTKASMRVLNDRLLVCNYLAVDVYKPDGSKEYRMYSYNPGTIRPNDVILDDENKAWIADNDNGLYHMTDQWHGTQILINGPLSAQVSAMDVSGNDLWAVPGGREGGYGSLYRQAQFYSFLNENWTSYSSANAPFLADMRDVLAVAVDKKNPKHAFLGTWGYGVIEYNDGQLVDVYNKSNSSLRGSVYDSASVFAGGLALDDNNNLWVTNNTAPNILSVRKADGTWRSFNPAPGASTYFTAGIIIDKSGQKWLQMRDHTLVVFNDNGTIDNPADDQGVFLTGTTGNGALPGTGAILSMTVDNEGQLWLGSDEGVAVIYSPENVFNGGNYDAQVVQVEVDGYLYDLLATEAITAITVNGDNEKWIGTDKAGVFLMSADGSKEIHHFTAEDSPLLSNTITSIKIAADGEVFFGTSKGIVSYMDYKIPPDSTLASVVVYPNPVRESYTGNIAIKGLVKDSNVKITDISGSLIWETQAEGGQVVWDGNNFSGRRANTGVYLVFITNTDGSQTQVAKILFVH